MCWITQRPPNKSLSMLRSTGVVRAKLARAIARNAKRDLAPSLLDFRIQKNMPSPPNSHSYSESWQDHVHQSHRAQFLRSHLNLYFSTALQRYAYISG